MWLFGDSILKGVDKKKDTVVQADNNTTYNSLSAGYLPER